MYSDRTLLQAFSNREDFLLTASLFDDDTGDPLDVSGRTLGLPGDYTSNLWAVFDGPIVTMSQSVITIPDYPIGNQLTAVALTVDPNLGILAGDPILIADLPAGTAIIGPFGPPPSPYVTEDGSTPYVVEGSGFTPPPTLPIGPNTMNGYVISYSPSTGALVVQVGFVFAFQISGHHHGSGNGFYSSSDIWYDNWETPIISASLGNGIMIVDIGVVEVLVPAALMRKLHRRAYLVGMGMTDSVNTRQILIGELPILSGALTSIPPISSINLPGVNGLP